MHTVRFVTVYWIQITAHNLYNTVDNIPQYSYCIQIKSVYFDADNPQPVIIT